MTDSEQLQSFSDDRLALFRAHGFEGEAGWLANSAGLRTATVFGGEGDRTVVLVHGTAMQAGEWALVAAKLGGRIVIPDWPGCGLSDPVDIRRSDPRKFGESWLAGVVDALGVEQVDIVGSSTGGYFALALALAQPQRVRRLVQVGAQPGLIRAAPLIFRLLATPGLGNLMMRKQPKDAEANRKEVYSNLVAHPERIPVEILENDLAAMVLPHAASTALALFRSLISPLGGVRPNLLIADELPNLTVPTLYLWGTEDNFVRLEKVRQVLERAPAVRLQTVSGAGHLLTLEEPGAIAEAVEEFLWAPA